MRMAALYEEGWDNRRMREHAIHAQGRSAGEPNTMQLVERTSGGRIVRSIPAFAALIWMGVIFALSARSTVPEPLGLAAGLTAIAGHLVAYAVLAALLSLALIGATAYGLSDEWHQTFVPGRDASVLDIVVDGIGALGGLAAVRWVGRLRTDTSD